MALAPRSAVVPQLALAPWSAVVPHLEQAPAVPVPKALQVLLLRFVSSLLAVHISHKEHFRQSELPLRFPLLIFFFIYQSPHVSPLLRRLRRTGIKGKSKPYLIPVRREIGRHSNTHVFTVHGIQPARVHGKIKLSKPVGIVIG